MSTGWRVGLLSSLAVVVVGAVVAGLFSMYEKNRVPEAPPVIRPDSTQGSIEVPQSGDTVSPRFAVKGTHTELAPGYHVWLATEVNGEVWPKEPEIGASDRRFNVTIFEEGRPSDGQFQLVLFQVSETGERQIMDWFEKYRGTGVFPGLAPSSLDGFARLDIKDLYLR